ncbi:carboxypeptidase regulatory-like domain-containing protein [Pedobacter sandarakinus]|uniref:carboxypeptidase regulatory-like domain-containing protein n=1 Tax=Pedobacter sandarakinus TaxID=353156 RepID=UPI002246A9D8|nr:carboxypeptidase regulatory-like domain-containing protein [Pedobacter sandarakinus]MCX2573846.1 carboxypeptidase regulatory-like domain-containing protein [Pedobacter sandarakinus]
MKKLGLYIIMLVCSSALFVAFTQVRVGGIIGRVAPSDAIVSVSLAGNADTVKAELSQGAFTFTNLKEGVYTLWIKANAPYKDTMIEKVAVKDSATTDLGEIKLQQ